MSNEDILVDILVFTTSKACLCIKIGSKVEVRIGFRLGLESGVSRDV